MEPGQEDFFEREAAEVMRQVLWRRRITRKQLCRALAGYGMTIAPSTLSNKINRGKFTFAFFIECLYAMNLNDVRIPLSGMSDEELAATRSRAEAKNKTKRKPPPAPWKASTAGTIKIARKRHE